MEGEREAARGAARVHAEAPGVESGSTLDFSCLLTPTPGGHGSSSQLPATHWETRTELLASVQPSPGSGKHLGSEPADEASLSASL